VAGYVADGASVGSKGARSIPIRLLRREMGPIVQECAARPVASGDTE
jgi:hypothetical protein